MQCKCNKYKRKPKEYHAHNHVHVEQFHSMTEKSCWVYVGVRTWQDFLCLLAIVILYAIVYKNALFSLFYVIREFHRFLHQGKAVILHKLASAFAPSLADLPTLTVSPWDSRFGVSTHGLTIWPPNLTVNQKILKLPNNSGSVKQYWKTVLKMAIFVTSNVWGKAGYHSDSFPWNHRSI